MNAPTVETLIQDIDFVISAKPVGRWPDALLLRIRAHLIADLEARDSYPEGMTMYRTNAKRPSRWPTGTMADTGHAIWLWQKHVNGRTDEFDTTRLVNCIAQGQREARICGASKGLLTELAAERAWASAYRRVTSH